MDNLKIQIETLVELSGVGYLMTKRLSHGHEPVFDFSELEFIRAFGPQLVGGARSDQFSLSETRVNELITSGRLTIQ